MIDRFVSYCKGHVDPGHRKAVVLKLLTLCLKEDRRRDMFFATLKEHPDFDRKSDDLDWIKAQFLKAMRGNDWQGNQLASLVNIAMGHEKPQVYTARLVSACSAANIDMNADAKNSPVIKELLLNWATRLPVVVQNQIQPFVKDMCDKPGTGGTIRDFIALVLRHVRTEPDRIVIPRYPCGWCSEDLTVTCTCSTAEKLRMKRGQPGHRPGETTQRSGLFGRGAEKENRLQGAEARNKDNPHGRLTKDEHDALLKKGLCFQCKKVWGQNKDCKSCSAKGNRAAGVNGMLPIVDPVEDRNEEYLESILDGAILGATMALSGHFSPEKTLASQRVTGSLTLNGKDCQGLHMDTLSDYSYVIAPFATRLFGSENEWKKKISKEMPPHQVACGNHGMLEILGSLDMEVMGDYGQPFKHRFYVLPSFPANIYCIIGVDLMKILGVELNNVPEGRKDSSLLALAIDEIKHKEQVRELVDLGYSLSKCSSELRLANKKDKHHKDLLFTYRARLEEYTKQAFDRNETIKGFCTHTQAEIKFETSDDIPVRGHPYAIPHSLQQHVDEYFEDLLKNGVIEEETELDHSLLSILVVPKHDLEGRVKGWRPCLDPRKINVKIVDPIYPLPLAEDIFGRLKGKKVFSVLDLKSGFNQIMVRPKDRKKTGFQWKGKVYHYVGAPFGFKNIPQDFQQIMDRIFHDMPFIMIYIDDLIISSDTHEEHIRHVKQVIDRLNEVNLRVNRSKCLLAYDRLVVLGNMISEEGQQIALGKLLKMDTWANPSNLKMLQRQLGFLNYFRGYIPNYSKLLAPIEELRTQGNNIKWKEEHTQIIRKIRRILETEILLVAPDYSRSLYVATDASKYGLGAILYQIDDNGKKHYIRMASRSLAPSEVNYGAPQRELRAVLEALRWFKVYLYGRKFTLYTDHQSLVYMLSRDKISSVIENWMHEILSFDFEIKHLPGIQNHLPDALSRFYDNDPRDEVRLDYSSLLGSLTGEKGKLQSLDSIWVEKAPVFLGITGLEQDDVTDGTVYTEAIGPDELELIEDKELQRIYIERAHISGNLGAGEMVRLIKASQRVIWNNMFRDCQRHVASCLPCQRYNVGIHGYHPPKNLKALLPFDHLCIDLELCLLRGEAIISFWW